MIKETKLYNQFLEDMSTQYPYKQLSNEMLTALILHFRDPNLLQSDRETLQREIYQATFRLIPHAIKVAETSCAPEELIGPAFEMLTRCIGSYDPETTGEDGRTATFATYYMDSVVPMLRTQAAIAARNKESPFYHSNYTEALISLAERARKSLREETGEEPTSGELLEKVRQLSRLSTGISPRRLDAVRENLMHARKVDLESMGEQVDPSNDIEVARSVGPLVEELLHKLREKDSTRRGVGTTPKRDADRILLYLLLMGYNQSEIALLLGLTSVQERLVRLRREVAALREE